MRLGMTKLFFNVESAIESFLCVVLHNLSILFMTLYQLFITLNLCVLEDSCPKRQASALPTRFQRPKNQFSKLVLRSICVLRKSDRTFSIDFDRRHFRQFLQDFGV